MQLIIYLRSHLNQNVLAISSLHSNQHYQYLILSLILVKEHQERNEPVWVLFLRNLHFIKAGFNFSSPFFAADKTDGKSG
jgi:hypothetical protein